VAVSGANTVTASVVDNGNGSYTATYTPTLAGTDAIAITMNGTVLNGSPFTSVVGPGPVSPTSSTVSVSPPAIPASAGTSNASIVVTAVDAAGNPVAGGTVVIQATGVGNTLVQPSGPTSGQGVATGTISSTGAGFKTITATVNGTSISQSPVLIVTPGPAFPGQTTAVVPGGKVFQATIVVITVRDQFGNRLTTGGESVVMTVTGRNPRNPATANDNGDGTYTASYTPIFLGTDTITITLNGVAIAGSPFTSAVGF
jgi:adhesin/invasin